MEEKAKFAAPGKGDIDRSQAGEGGADTQVNAFGRLFILLSTVFMAMAIVVLIPVLPVIGTHFSATPNAAAMVRSLISSVSLAMIFGSLLAGVLADRFGIRRVLIASLLLYGLAGTAGFFLDSLAQILVSRVVVGLAAAIITILGVALVATAFEASARERWMGWISGASIVGSLVIVPLAGVIGNLGWRYVFLMHLIALPVLLLAMAGIRTVPHRARTAEETAQPRPSAPGLPRLLWPLSVLALMGGATMNALPIFLPFHLAEIGEGMPSRISFAMFVATLMGAVISFAYGWTRRCLSMPHLFAMGYLIGGAGLLLVSKSHDYDIVLVGVGMTGVGFGVTLPNLNALAAAISAPGQSGRVIGLVIGAFSAGAPMAQFSLELISGGQPAAVAIGLLAILAMLLGIVWLLVARPFRAAAG